MKHNFYVGGRVAMYGTGETNSTFWDGDRGTVLSINNNILTVMPDDFPEEKHLMHFRQCRKLVKRPRRRVWVDLVGLQKGLDNVVASTLHTSDINGTWVEFIEVRKK